jgi:membrane associated rhomboid family serine protease
LTDEDISGAPIVCLRTSSGQEVAVELEEFEELIKAGQVGPMTRVRFPLVTGEYWVPAQELEFFRGLYSPDRIAFHEQFNLRRFPLVTAIFVVINTAVFIVIQKAYGWYGDAAPLVMGAKAAPLIEEAGQLWRLLTFNFVHADKLHLLANMGFVLVLGLALENAFSRRSYLLIMASSAICSGVASYLLTDSPSAGASGIVYGILSALIVFGIKYRAVIPRSYTYYFGWSLLPLLLITVYAGLAQPLVDNWGHVGGLVGGVIACLVLPAEVLENKVVSASGWAVAVASLLLVAVVTLVGAPVVSRLTVGEARFEDTLGLSVTYPDTWVHRAYDRYGFVEYRHRDFPYVRMTLGSVAGRRALDPHQAMSHRLGLLVVEAEEEGEIDGVSGIIRRRLRLDGQSAEVAAYSYGVDGRRYYREVYVITRGNLEHLVILTTLEPWRQPFASVFSSVIASIRIGEPQLRVGDETDL